MRGRADERPFDWMVCKHVTSCGLRVVSINHLTLIMFIKMEQQPFHFYHNLLRFSRLSMWCTSLNLNNKYKYCFVSVRIINRRKYVHSFFFQCKLLLCPEVVIYTARGPLSKQREQTHCSRAPHSSRHPKDTDSWPSWRDNESVRGSSRERCWPRALSSPEWESLSEGVKVLILLYSLWHKD